MAWVILVIGHGAEGFSAVGLGMHHDVGAVAVKATPAGVVAALPMWIVMSIAMMVPGAIPAVRHVTSNSLRRRRQRAAAEFVAAYLAIWTLFGAVALAVTGAAATAWGADAVLVAALGTAAVWQLLPARRRWLGRCHLTVPLPPRGRRALQGCLRFGTRHGWACVVLCWPMMMIMTVNPHPAIVWMALLTAMVTGEKVLMRPYPWASALAFLLGAIALNLAFVR